MGSLVRRIQARLTYANVVATIALFVAMGGTAYAAATIGSSQIIDGSILSRDIATGTITSADVKSGSMIGDDIANGSVTGTDVNEASLADVDAETFDGLDSTQFAGGNALRWSFGMTYNDAAVDIGTLGPLSFEARCVEDPGVIQAADIRITTTVDDVVIDGALKDIADSPIPLVSATDIGATTDVELLDVRDPTDTLGLYQAPAVAYVNSHGSDCWFEGNLTNLMG